MDFSTTLADSLLDDLDDLSDSEQKEETSEEKQDGELNVVTEGGGEINNTQQLMKENGFDYFEKKKSLPVKETSKTREFVEDPKLQSHLKAIASTSNSAEDKNEEGYALMSTSNKYLQSIESIIQKAHSDLTLAYKTKFPELEDLIPDPMAYKNAIKVIQNEMDMTVINEELNSIAKLTSNQIITISVASSTTSGRPLTTEELHKVNQCIGFIEEILDIKAKLIGHVEQHMEYLAPNMVVLIGPTLAARMVSAAGGMAELSRIPSCNLQVLGQVKATSASRAGLSTSNAAASSAAAAGGSIVFKPHEGLLRESTLYKLVPSHLQKKALKVIAAKLALCIRCDFVNLESGRPRTKTSGLKFRSEIEQKFVKWEEPDAAPVVKALPK